MKKKYFCIIFLLIISLIYISNINQIPNKIYLIEGESISIKKVFGIDISNSKKEKEVWENKETQTEKLNVKLFGILKVKEVSVTTYPKVKVIPTGNLIGIKLYTNGVLVIGTTEIKNEKNEIEKPFEKSGIKEGDTIIEVEGEKINTINELKNIVNLSRGNEITIKYLRNDEVFETKIIPAKVSEKEYKLGIWVRDSASRSWNNVIL